MRNTLCGTMVPHSLVAACVKPRLKFVWLAHVAARKLRLASACIGPQESGCVGMLMLGRNTSLISINTVQCKLFLQTHRVDMIRVV
jgi:hypothetical protein